MTTSRLSPPFLIALAAMLWGSDLLLRPQSLSAGWSPAWLVLGEHLLLCVLFAPALWLGRAQFALLTRRQWIALLFVGWGGSALATWLYVSAFALDGRHPLVVSLLQKTQPIIAVTLAGLVLGERRTGMFWFWGGCALVGAYFLSGLRAVPSLKDVRAQQALLALGAAFLWGAATVAGRLLTSSLTPGCLAAARFLVAVPMLAALTLVPTSAYPAPVLLPHLYNLFGPTQYAALFLLLIVLLPDLLGMVLYYFGLRGTPASVATLAELCYPLTALAIGVFVQHTPMTLSQGAGLLLLIFAVVGLGRKPGVAAPTLAKVPANARRPGIIEET